MKNNLSHAKEEPRFRNSENHPFEILSGFGWQQIVEIPFHWHDSIELIYINQGQLLVHTAQSEYVVKKNHMILIHPNEIHSTIMPEGYKTEIFVIKTDIPFLITSSNLTEKYSQLFQKNLPLLEPVNIFEESKINSISLKDTFKEILSEENQKSFAYELSIQNKITSILISILRYWEENKIISHDSHLVFEHEINTISLYIKKNLEKNITANECATMCNLSYSHFSREFKRVYKQNFKDYLINLRLEKAVSILLSSDKIISEISELCGFSSVSYFISTFKKKHSISPLKYRNIHTKGL